MKFDFSKPSADVAKESREHFNQNDTLLERQTRLSAILNRCPDRSKCLICNHSLKESEVFNHRSTIYCKCSFCGHIQTKAQPPDSYPTGIEGGLKFNKIYSKLTNEEFESRKNRIYRPKLDWILSCHQKLGISNDEMKELKWLELGCGAGYFLDALSDVCINRIKGLEEDIVLVETANEKLKDPVVQHYNKSLGEAVQEYDADIYAAFFVLEHIEYTKSFFESLRHKPKGTTFCFSAQMFGFGALLESGIDHFFARNLDSVVHTQLYTHDSIKYCLDYADYEVVAQWIFGQDSADLSRMLMTALKGRYSEKMLDFAENQIARIVDPFQGILDQNFFSDSAHFIAVKR